MHLNFNEETESLLRQHADQARCSDEIEAYIAHQVKADRADDFESPAHLTIDEAKKLGLDRMIDAGSDSSPALPMSRVTGWSFTNESMAAKPTLRAVLLCRT